MVFSHPLSHICKLGAPLACIGGTGTFDGVFLTGFVAVLLNNDGGIQLAVSGSSVRSNIHWRTASRSCSAACQLLPCAIKGAPICTRSWL